MPALLVGVMGPWRAELQIGKLLSLNRGSGAMDVGRIGVLNGEGSQMAGVSSHFWGYGPHFLYHGLGQEVVVAVYDLVTGEQIEGCIIKAWYGNVEVMLPNGSGSSGCRVVVVG